MPWDTGRAVLANIPLIVILCRPVGRLFERIRDRFAPEIEVIQSRSRIDARIAGSS